MVLDQTAPPLSNHPGLTEELSGLRTAAEREKRLLEVQDEGIDATLKKYKDNQQLGQQINELIEGFFNKYPRSFDDAWPSQSADVEKDKKLRALLEKLQGKGYSVKDFQKMQETVDLAQVLGFEFSNDQTGFQMADLIRKRQQGEMASQVGA